MIDKTITTLIGYYKTDENIITIKQLIWNRILQKRLARRATS